MRHSDLSAIPRWAWVGAGLLVVAMIGAAVLLYIFLPPGTASFLIIAGLIVSACGAGPVLLGAYSRHKAQQRARDEDRAETFQPPDASNTSARS